MKKRVLPVLLALCLCLGLITPVPARAAALDDNLLRAQQTVIEGCLAYEDNIDLTAYKIPVSQVTTFFNDLVRPRNAITMVRSYSYRWSPSTNCVVSLKPVYWYDRATTMKLRGEMEAAIARILADIDPEWSDLEKVLYVHDYLALNTGYDSTYTNGRAEHALLEGSAVCQGYAEAFREIMFRLDIPCMLVSSKALNHAWNLVSLNGRWYHLDVTWDDPTPDRLGRVKHTMFLKSTEYFLDPARGDHNADDWECDGGIDPYGDAFSTDLDDAMWNGVDAPLCPMGGKWYTNIDNTLVELLFDPEARCFRQVRTLTTVSDRWYTDDSSYSYYTGAFAGCAGGNGKLYYLTPDRLMSLDPASGARQIVFTLNAQNGLRLYGHKIDPLGTLHYVASTAPSEAGTEGTIALPGTALTGAFLCGDGVTRFFEGSVCQLNYSGFAPLPNGDWCYLKNGSLDATLSGSFTHTDGAAYSVKNGMAATTYPNLQTVLVDGVPVEFHMYALKQPNGNLANYVQVRDLAHVLNGTGAQFSVGFDSTSIFFDSGEPYADVGTEMWTPFSGSRLYQNSTSVKKVNGAVANLEAFVLSDGSGGGYTYYKLRDLGKALGFNVGYSAGTGIFIETDKPYTDAD